MDNAQRAREWLLGDTHGMHYGADYERRARSLTSLLDTVAAEAWAGAIEQAAGIIPAIIEDEIEDGYAIDVLRNVERRIRRALAPDPSLVGVSREDLAHATETCGCVPLVCNRLPNVGRLDWPEKHVAAIGRLQENT